MPHMMQLMDTVRFLGNARIVHRAINPSSVLVTSGGAWELARGGRILVPVLSAEPGMPNQVPLAGAWKLAGFGHALYLDEFVEGQSEGSFAYPVSQSSFSLSRRGFTQPVSFCFCALLLNR